MREKQFLDITKWQEETFGEATPLSKVSHLREEVVELQQALMYNEPNVRLEYADCILLIYGSASANGMSYEDICKAIAEKMEINKNRDWGKPDANGVVKHVKS